MNDMQQNEKRKKVFDVVVFIDVVDVLNNELNPFLSDNS
mgnify:CR=1 FL=1